VEIVNIDTKEKEIKENIQEVIKRIFAICKNDENLRSRQNIKVVEENIEITNKKIKNHQALLSQAGKIKEDLVQKITELKQKNSELKEKLLEDLGSEL
jgi:hypothetical protein